MKTQKDFAGQLAVVTGAAAGLGREMAEAFSGAGAAVVLVDKDDNVGAAANEISSRTGSTAHHIIGDVGEEGTWQQVSAFVNQAGASRVILVNNAGVYRRGRVEELSLDDADLLYRVNQRAILLGVAALRDALRNGDGGAVVNISSTAGIKGDPDTSAYSGTKWAVRGITKALAAELGGDGIRVNTVVPGLIETAMADANGPDVNAHILANVFLGRIGQPNEIAPAVLFLASADASYISGAEVVIDAGLSV